MKKVNLLIILMLTLLLCKGQSLLQEGKLWSNTSIGTMPGSTYRSYFIKFKGDTTINGLGYKKIMKSDDPLHTKWTLNGCIREEPTKRKVFIFNETNGKDRLLYDFSLEKGDSILTGDGKLYAKVTNVINGTFGSSLVLRKQICFFDPNANPLWIEGIGSLWGVLEGLNNFYTTGSTTNLVCYSENDQLVYHHPEFSNCFPEGEFINPNQRFISENKVWRIGSKIYSEPCCGHRNDAYKFNGDSIINDTTYRKLYTTTNEDLSNWQLKGLWRETSDQKIIVRHLYYHTESLLYDFALVKNDIFITQGVTLKVDSVVIHNWGGKLRKHWYLNPVSGDAFHRTIWIEGVGQENNFTRNINGSVGALPILMCFIENGKPVYQNPEYNTCFYTSTIEISNPAKDFKVFPNPVSNELIVEGNFNKKVFGLELYSVKGELVKTGCLEDGSNLYRMDVESLKSGVYILHLVSASGKYAEEVIIKK